jgi:dextranase
LLFDPDVVARDERRDAIDVRSGQHMVSTGAGGIWSSVREKGPFEMIHLVNLIGVNDDIWRNAAPAPQTQQNITFRYYGPRVAQAQSAFYATPDDGTGQPQALALAKGSDSRGAYVEFVVPRLEYWDVVVLREPQ